MMLAVMIPMTRTTRLLTFLQTVGLEKVCLLHRAIIMFLPEAYIIMLFVFGAPESKVTSL